MERTECKTKEDLFHYIDSLWSEEDRRRIMEADVDCMHFGFGLWVRNHLIYPGDVPVVSDVRNWNDSMRFSGFDPDEISAKICDEYQRYLQLGKVVEREILNLTISKRRANAISKNEVKRLYRPTTSRWAKILGVLGKNENGITEIQGVKRFDEIYCCSKNKKWFLWCKIKKIVVVKVDDDFLKYYGHEYKAKLGSYVFVIVLGDHTFIDMQLFSRLLLQ